MTWTTPELTPLSPNFVTTPMGGRSTHIRFNVHQANNHSSSSVELGFEPCAFRIGIRDLATKPFLSRDYTSRSQLQEGDNTQILLENEGGPLWPSGKISGPRRVPGSKLDSTEDPLCIGPIADQLYRYWIVPTVPSSKRRWKSEYHREVSTPFH
ncbi:hypothetical protein AVEN_41720-1 [Araneus ventricosus]|uniref:Uncharacterized protein n=1 Tax=Araneus ventricosus TaxID=182803 RepID=A0A4Y2ABM9_ARAVE|nr:hypothetical protein AVEN_41720-1 [Araneus ventricosus]